MKPHAQVKRIVRNDQIFWEYRGVLYPDRLTHKNATENILETALKYCQGGGIDVGAGRFPFSNAISIQNDKNQNAYALPEIENESLDYVYSSHCLEHLTYPWDAVKLWISKLRTGGVIFLYLPHPDMKLWRPGAPWVGDQHKWIPEFETVKWKLQELGLKIVGGDGERDNLWSWYIVARKIPGVAVIGKVDEKYIEDFFEGKRVLVLGSGPNVRNLEARFMETFDLIVRANNYQTFNSCKRTDIYASFFGKSIRKKPRCLLGDGCKLLMCKCPEGEIVVKNKDGTINNKLSDNYDWIYEYRRDFFKDIGLPYYIPPTKNFNENNALVGQICTTGVSVILDVLRCNPKYLYFAGFDFAMSGLHDIKKRMVFKACPNCHHWEDEFNLMKKLCAEKANLDCSPEIKKLFAGSYKRHCSWTQ